MAQAGNYSSLTVDSTNPIKRWSHRARFDVALRITDPQAGETILDYGTGDAFILGLLKRANPSVKCVGYDPGMDMAAYDVKAEFPDTELYTELTPLKGRTFSKVLCFETLEHFEGAALESRLDELTALVDAGGALIVSVPIEVGPASLFKNSVRAQMGKLHEGTTLQKVLMSAVYGRNIKRSPAQPGGYINSHIGFDYRGLPPLFERRNFHLDRVFFSPFPYAVTSALNSQVFFRFSRR